MEIFPSTYFIHDILFYEVIFHNHGSCNVPALPISFFECSSFVFLP